MPTTPGSDPATPGVDPEASGEPVPDPGRDPAVDPDPVLFPHAGSWGFHDDDCRCVWGDVAYCNRGGWVWSCCGSCKERSDCSAPHTHPTYWGHPKSSGTHAGFERHWPVYRSNAEIRALAPECFGAG